MLKVIIADDSSTARLFARRCLEIAGCPEAEFHEAGSGQEALDLLRTQAADLLVTDLVMPKMSGEDLLKAVRAEAELKHLPVIVITSENNLAKKIQLLQQGANAVLSKPLTPPQLAKTLERIFNRNEEAPA